MPKSGVACLRTIANSGRYRKYSLHGHVLEYGIPRSMLGSQAAEVVVNNVKQPVTGGSSIHPVLGRRGPVSGCRKAVTKGVDKPDLCLSADP